MSTREDENSKIAEFVEISQTSPDEARELLEACEWDLQVSKQQDRSEGRY